MEKPVFCLLLPIVAAVFSVHAENLVRNGDFSHGQQYNGSVMRYGNFDVGASSLARQEKSGWHVTPFEGWWLFAGKGMNAIVEDAGNMLAMSGHGILYSVPQPMNGGVATLSFDIKTDGASGTVSLKLLNREENKFLHSPNAEKQIAVPENTNGKFQRLQVTVAGTGKLLAGLEVALAHGKIVLDNVQIEAGNQASAFRPRPGEWLEITVDDFTPESLPRWYADGGEGKKAGVRTLSVTNRSGEPLSGTLNLYLDHWERGGKTLFSSLQLNCLEPGKSISVPFEPGKLSGDGYVVLAELIQNGKPVVSREIFNPKNTACGNIGEHMLSGYNGLRFGIFPPVTPAKTFGVGNGMIAQGQWWGGVAHDNLLLARQANLVGLGPMSSALDDDVLFSSAIAGAQRFEGIWVDTESKNPALNNPGTRNALDIFNPDSKRELKERANKVGQILASGPGINGLKLRNESTYFNGGRICPTLAADAAFRDWCRKRYGTLDVLNGHWGTSYHDWNQVEQIVSARMAKQPREEEKQGAAAIDWFANLGRLGDDAVTLMKQNPGRAMDWNRWRTAATLELFGDCIDEIRKYDRETLVGNNFCWPNFWPQVTMPFFRKSENAMLDVQYAAGNGSDLGNSDEMLDSLEMAESTVPGKPIWGIEVYIQPSFPAEFPALQNWGMVAHGMTNNLVFAWKPYSDHGPKEFASGPGAWKRPDAHPMWMLIDTDGTKLPLWYNNLKSAEEIAAFHKKYDGFSLKRLKSRTGWYLSYDTNEFVVMMTANRPYNSNLVHSRIVTAAQLRMNGVTLNYLDDDCLSSMTTQNYDTILMPPSPVMSDAAAGRLAEFVKDGGTLVLLGPCGVYDPWLNSRQTFGGKEWEELGWKVPALWKDFESFRESFNTPSLDGLTSCKNFPPLPDGESLRGSDGLELARSRKWGKGRIIAATVYPSRSSTLVHAPGVFSRYLKWLIAAADLKDNGHWVPDRENTPEDLKARIGYGSPIVEVVVREKSPQEKFAFVLNQGGSGSGTIRIPVGNVRVHAENAITGSVVPGNVENGEWQCRKNLVPWEYLIVRLILEKQEGMIR